MKSFWLGLVLGASLSCNAAQAVGISLEGVTGRALITALLMSGNSSRDYASAHALADKILAGK